MTGSPRDALTGDNAQRFTIARLIAQCNHMLITHSLDELGAQIIARDGELNSYRVLGIGWSRAAAHPIIELTRVEEET